MVNIAKLRTAARYAREHPDEHDQAEWGYRFLPRTGDTACDTAYCLAGLSGMLDNARMRWTAHNLVDGVMVGHGPLIGIDDRSPYSYGAMSYGLSDSQADALFRASNTLDLIDAMIDILEVEPEIPGIDLRVRANRVLCGTWERDSADNVDG